MELKQIKELMSAMERTGVTKINLKEKSYEICLERENTKVVHVNHPPFAVDHNYMLPVSNAQAFLRDTTVHTPFNSLDVQANKKCWYKFFSKRCNRCESFHYFTDGGDVLFNTGSWNSALCENRGYDR